MRARLWRRLRCRIGFHEYVGDATGVHCRHCPFYPYTTS